MTRRRRTALLVSVTLAAVGLLVSTTLDRHAPKQASAAIAPPAPAATPCSETGTVVEVGVEMQHPHTADGATAAAVAYARYAETAVGAPEATVVAAENTMAADATRAALVTDTTTKLRALYAVYPADQLTYRVAVLATRTTLHSTDAARVELWQVTVLSTPPAPPRQDWSTLTYELVWERDDWRVTTEVTQPGPYPAAWPQVVASSSGELDARLAGFTNRDQP